MSRLSSLFVIGCLGIDDQDAASLLQKQQMKVTSDHGIRMSTAAEAMIQRSHETKVTGASAGYMERSLLSKGGSTVDDVAAEPEEPECPNNITITVDSPSTELPTAQALLVVKGLSDEHGPLSFSKVEDYGGHPQYRSPSGYSLFYNTTVIGNNSIGNWHVTNSTGDHILISPTDSNYKCHEFDGAWHKADDLNTSFMFHFNQAIPRNVTSGGSTLLLRENGYQRNFDWDACGHNRAFFSFSGIPTHHAAAVNGMMACNDYKNWCDFFSVVCDVAADYPWEGTTCSMTLYSMATAPNGTGQCNNCAFQSQVGAAVYFKDSVGRSMDYTDVNESVQQQREDVSSSNTACPLS